MSFSISLLFCIPVQAANKISHISMESHPYSLVNENLNKKAMLISSNLIVALKLFS